jgi:hypothetical protein
MSLNSPRIFFCRIVAWENTHKVSNKLMQLYQTFVEFHDYCGLDLESEVKVSLTLTNIIQLFGNINGTVINRPKCV